MRNLDKYKGVIPAFYACYDEKGEISPAGVQRLAQYFIDKGVSKEKKMVRWPSGKDLFKYSVMVLTLMVFFGLYFYLLDVLFTFLKGLVS